VNNYTGGLLEEKGCKNYSLVQLFAKEKLYSWKVLASIYAVLFFLFSSFTLLCSEAYEKYNKYQSVFT